MRAADRIGDKNWDVYDEEQESTCNCGRGKQIKHYTVASHEKVPRIERDLNYIEVRCNSCNPGSV